MTALEHLRQVSLAHAHHDLLAADPARTTVTAVAYRWGFPSANRFTTAAPTASPPVKTLRVFFPGRTTFSSAAARKVVFMEQLDGNESLRE